MHRDHESYDIEWYRPGLLGSIIAVWSVGAVLMTIGVLACAVAIDNTGRVPLVWARIAGLIGGLGTISGALVGLLGILRVLSRDPVCLVLRRDGIVLRERDEETIIPWERLMGCRSEGRVLVLKREGEEPLRIRHRFMGASSAVLAQRIPEVQRQVLLGVLDMKQRHSIPVGRVRSDS